MRKLFPNCLHHYRPKFKSRPPYATKHCIGTDLGVPTQGNLISVQAIKDALWAFATMGYAPTQAFLDQCAAHCLHQLSAFNPQNVANVAWAYAKFGYAPQNLFAAMAQDVGPSSVCQTSCTRCSRRA